MIQIMVINIEAFRKELRRDAEPTEDEQKSNVIYRENDRIRAGSRSSSSRPPPDRHHRRAAERGHDTEKAQEAIEALNPLCTLRYSATHRNPYNLVYKLDPIRGL